MRETSSLILDSNPSGHNADFDAVGIFLASVISTAPAYRQSARPFTVPSRNV